MPLPAVMPASNIDLEHTIILPLLLPQLSLQLREVAMSVARLLSSVVSCCFFKDRVIFWRIDVATAGP